MSRDEQELGALLRSLPNVPDAWREAAKRIPRQLRGDPAAAREPSHDAATESDAFAADPADEPVQGS
jgi:hypothetical protein